jgi:hypothetical protein
MTRMKKEGRGSRVGGGQTIRSFLGLCSSSLRVRVIPFFLLFVMLLSLSYSCYS